jgi:drug/metabolite transporter (DMT)-like permease
VLGPVVIAFAAACGFALSTSIQHRAAATAPETTGQRRAGLLRYLITNPGWLLGVTVGAIAWGFHAWALKRGSIVVVQPVIVSGIVLSIPLRAALDRCLPSPKDMACVVITAVGLGVFLVTANPTPGHPHPDPGAGEALTLAGVLAATVLIFAASRRRDQVRAFMLGTAAGVLFGLAAGLIKVVVGAFDGSAPQHSLESWPLWALVAGGGLGVALNQKAYRVAPLTVSMPILNIVGVLVALAFGVVVFGETLARTPLALTYQAASLLCMATGLLQAGGRERRAARC